MHLGSTGLRRHFRPRRIISFAACGFLAAVGLPLTHAQAVPLDPGCIYQVNRSATPGYATYKVHYGNTCGDSSQAYIHYNGFPDGTYYKYGTVVNGVDVTSVAYTDIGTPICTYGSQYHDTLGWHKESFGGSGC